MPSTDGVQVAVYDLGGPTDPATPLLVLCHATGFCGGVWRPIAAQLTDTFRCVTLDFRAHGRSPIPEGLELDWRGMGRDLLAVVAELRQLGITDGPIFGAGHSMGAASIVMAELAEPGTFDRAWGFEPILFSAEMLESTSLSPSGHVLMDSPLIDATRRRRATFDSQAEAIERYASRPPYSSLDPAMLEAYVEHGFEEHEDGTISLRCHPDHEAEIFAHSVCGAYEHLDELNVSFQVGASGDGQASAAIARRICDEHETFSLLEYNDLTHLGVLEAPNRIAADIRRWLAT